MRSVPSTHGTGPVALNRLRLLAYGILGLPLAFVALPIYVHVPQLYASAFGLSLSTVGAVLLLARLWDAFVDPLIGAMGDRLRQRKLTIALSLPLLCGGVLGLLRPPAAWVSASWLGAMLFIVYLGYSLASVNHQAWGADLSPDAHERTRVVAVREAFALLGIVVAAALPSVLSNDMATGLASSAVWFAVLLCGLAAVCLRWAPDARLAPHPAQRPPLTAALKNPRYRALLTVFAISGIAAAIPATLVLFFIADVLRASTYAGAFLAVYFVSAAICLPLWLRLARAMGKLTAWGIGMLLSVLVFMWASVLGEGDIAAFFAICILSGAALGADVTLPASVLADIAGDDAINGTGAYFGWWSFLSKLNLALAAGLSLPLLSLLGYAPDTANPAGLAALAVVYAGIPAALKALSIIALWCLRARIQGDVRAIDSLS